MQSECTKDVADCFPELLPALVSVAIPADDTQSSALINEDIIHRLNCVVLGKLLDVNQDLLVYVFVILIYRIYLSHRCTCVPCCVKFLRKLFIVIIL